MTLTTAKINDFAKDDYDLLKDHLGKQLQKHFDLLVEAVPTIQSIEWTSSQEDEMLFDLTYFKVSKDNGYVFEYRMYEDYNSKTLLQISMSEFILEEIELISTFKNYLDSLSHLIVILWGSENFRLDTKQIPISISSFQKIKM